MYAFFNRHFNLGIENPSTEKDYVPLTRDELTVWNDQHPKPAIGDAGELTALRALDAAQSKQIGALAPKNAGELKRYRSVIGGALDVLIGHGVPASKELEWEQKDERQVTGGTLFTSVLRNKTHGTENPVVFVLPEPWNKQVVVWAHEQGKRALFTADGQPKPELAKLLKAGVAVALLDVIHQGEYQADGQPLTQTPKVPNKREFAGFTTGFNHPVFSQRVQDLLSLLSFVKHHKDQPSKIHLVGMRGAAPWIAAAAAMAARDADVGPVLGRVAISLNGFRFANVMDIRDPQLLPGAVKYGDIGGMLGLCAPHPLWLNYEPDAPLAQAKACYAAAGAPDAITSLASSSLSAEMGAVEWLLS